MLALIRVQVLCITRNKRNIFLYVLPQHAVIATLTY